MSYIPCSIDESDNLWIYPIHYDDPSKYPSPSSLPINSPFGYRYHPISGNYKMHNGVDLGYAQGTCVGDRGPAIVATRAGTVSVSAFQGGGAGNYVWIDHGDGYKSVYMHLYERASVSVGDVVAQGQQIGLMGTTGGSTGVHLHFGISRGGIYVDPVPYISKEYCSEEDFSVQIKTEEEKSPINKKYNPKLSLVSGDISGANSQLLMARRGAIIDSYKMNLLEEGQNLSLMTSYGSLGCGQSVLSATPVPDVPPYTLDWITDNILNKGTRINPGNFKRGAIPSRNISVSTQDTTFTTTELEIMVLYIAKFFLRDGWSPSATVAILANMYCESGLNPQRWENDTVYSEGDRNRGCGLVGWTPWYKFTDGYLPRNYVTDPEKNEPIKNLDTQLRRVVWDMENNQYWISNITADPDWKPDLLNSNAYKEEGSAFREYVDANMQQHGNKIFYLSAKEFMSSSLPIEILTVAFMVNFERPDRLNIDSRVSIAKRFEEIVGDTTFIRTESPTEDAPYWNEENNPYPFGTNLNYSYGRATEILSSKGIINRSGVCNIPDKNWVEFNNEGNQYRTGRVPMGGAIACWRTLDGGSYTAVVEKVFGSEIVFTSEVNDNGEFIYQQRNNYDGNWGIEDKDNYVFEGFIYLCNITPATGGAIEVAMGNAQIVCASNKKQIATLCCGTTDFHNCNSLSLTCDVDIETPMPLSEIDFSSLSKNLDMVVYVSQQLVNLEKIPSDFDWTNVTAANPGKTVAGPSPYGIGVVHHSTLKKVVDDGNYVDSASHFSKEDWRLDFPISNIMNAMGNELFNINWQTYFCIMLVANGDYDVPSSISVNIKEFTINR